MGRRALGVDGRRRWGRWDISSASGRGVRDELARRATRELGTPDRDAPLPAHRGRHRPRPIRRGGRARRGCARRDGADRWLLRCARAARGRPRRGGGELRGADRGRRPAARLGRARPRCARARGRRGVRRSPSCRARGRSRSARPSSRTFRLPTPCWCSMRSRGRVASRSSRWLPTFCRPRRKSRCPTEVGHRARARRHASPGRPPAPVRGSSPPGSR